VRWRARSVSAGSSGRASRSILCFSKNACAPMNWPRRSQPRRIRPPRIGVAVAMLLVAILVARYAVDAPNQPAQPVAFAQVERVVDGDTLLLADQTRVRLQGIDTPETVKPDTPPQPWGQEATEFTRAFLAAGPVRLEFDRERTD